MELNAILDNKSCIAEILALLSIANECDITSAIDNIYSKGLICRGVNGKFILTDSGINLLNNVNIASTKGIPSKQRLIELAKKMKEIFPKGMKDNKYPWQSSANDISIFLGRFFIKYPNITDEEILDATKRYVEHFEDNPKAMRLLKYFIIKGEKKPFIDESGNMIYKVVETSDLASWIENKEDENKRDELLFSTLI